MQITTSRLPSLTYKVVFLHFHGIACLPACLPPSLPSSFFPSPSILPSFPSFFPFFLRKQARSPLLGFLQSRGHALSPLSTKTLSGLITDPGPPPEDRNHCSLLRKLEGSERRNKVLVQGRGENRQARSLSPPACQLSLAWGPGSTVPPFGAAVTFLIRLP